MCFACATEIVKEFNVPIEYAGSARIARTTAEKAYIPMLDGLGLRGKVRRFVLAYGGIVENPTGAEELDADKLRAASPFAAFAMTKRREVRTEPEQEPAQTIYGAPLALNPAPVSRGSYFQKPMAIGEDQKARQVGKDGWD
jgi:hypothetical protein